MFADFGFFDGTFLARIVVGQKWRKILDEQHFAEVKPAAKGRLGTLEETLRHGTELL